MHIIAMRTFLLILIVASLTASADAQVLTQVNYFYQYDAGKGYSFQLNPVRLSDTWKVFYKLEVQDTSKTVDDFSLTWETRTSLDEKKRTGHYKRNRQSVRKISHVGQHHTWFV